MRKLSPSAFVIRSTATYIIEEMLIGRTVDDIVDSLHIIFAGALSDSMIAAALADAANYLTHHPISETPAPIADLLQVERNRDQRFN